MSEIKDSPPPVVKQESFKPKVERILKITKDCLSGKLSPVDAFRQIADRNPNSKETPESIASTLNENKIEAEQNKTKQEIDDITKKLKVDLPQEPLIIKDEYYCQKEKELGTFIDSNQTQSKKNLSEKITSTIPILKLKTSGIRNATGLYNALRKIGFKNDDILDKQIINNLKKIRSKDTGLGIDRLNRLGFNLKKDNLNDIDVRYLILKASNIPKYKFNNACLELSPYFILQGRKNDISYNSCNLLENLLDIAQNGKLDQEVKNKLDFFKERIMLEKNKKDVNSEDLLSVFNTNEAFSFPDSFDQEIFNSNFKFIYKNLDKFNNPSEFIENISQEQIDQLPNNENGIVDFSKQIYEAAYDKDSAKEIIEYVLKNQDKIQSSFRDESQRSQFILDLIKSTSQLYEGKRRDFIKKFQKINIGENISFSDKNDQNYWNLISNIEKPNLALSLIDNKDKFFDNNNFPKFSYFKEITKNGESFSEYSPLKGIYLNYLEDDFFSKFSLKDKMIWSVSRNILIRDNDNKDDSKYFSKIDELLEFINQTDGINPKFFDKIKDEYGEKYLRGVITDEVLNALPPQDKVFWKLYKDFYSNIDGYNINCKLDQLFKIKDNFSQFFDEKDNLNSLFFEKIFRTLNDERDNHNYENIFNLYLTEENINKLDAPDKVFWDVYKSFSFEKSNIGNHRLFDKKRGIKDFLIKNKDNFKSNYLNKDNQLTSSFVADIMKIKDQNGYLLLSISDELKPLLATESIFNNLIPEEKLFWKNCLDADIYNYNGDNPVRSILLKNKDDYKKFIDSNGHPTPFLFESVYKSYNVKYNFGGCPLLNLGKVSDEDMSNFSPLDKIFWTTYRDSFWPEGKNLTSDLSYEGLRYFLLNNYLTEGSDFSKFLDQDSHFNNFFLESLAKERIAIPPRFLSEENLINFNDQDKIFWKVLLRDTTITPSLANFLVEHKKDFDTLYSKDLSVTPLFLKLALQEGHNLNLEKFISQDFINNRPEDEINFWDKFKKISPNSQKKIIEIYFKDTLSISEKYNYVVLFEKIDQSPSREILKIRDQLLKEIIKNDNPEEVFEKISNIFIKNNLPEFVKKYKVFEVLYPKNKIDSSLNEKSSRVLFTNKSNILRHSIVFNDLAKSNLESGNVSLKNYLTFFKESDSLLEKGKNGGSLTEKENRQLTYFLKKLETVYDNSFLSRINQNKTSESSVLTEKINNLYQNYHVKEGQKISDRVVEMYFSGLGIKTIDQSLAIMKETKETAHNRGLKYFNDSDISIEPNDLIKGVGSNILASILSSGPICREFLGAEADSDATPFDADVCTNIFNTEYSNKGIREFIEKTPAKGYGDLILVIKNRGQFQNTSTEKSTVKYQSEKLEVFSTSYLGETHFGVRTGFPSSEIDYIITQDSIKDDSKKLEDIYYEIAKHGVYIPIANLDGQIIFTPDDYNKYRQAFDGVDQFNGKPISVEISKEKDWSHPLIQAIKKDKEKEEKESTIKSKDEQIRARIKEILTGIGVEMKDDFDTSVLGAKLYNIGSSGRNTNIPNDFDFDYTLILDVPGYSKASKIKEIILSKFDHTDGAPTDQDSQIRMSQVTGISSEPIDLDIGINTFADTLIFSSNESIEQKLNSIKQNFGEEGYQEVVANIILTKQILKENHAYKKGNSQDGGLGGIGVENWILDNNGNIEKAFKTFWKASHQDGMIIPLDEFRKIYPILDAGQNLRETNRTHDNFSFVLTEKGYQAMITAIGKYIK